MVFNNGQEIEDVDIIIYATGYKYNFPFLDKNENLINIMEDEKDHGSIEPLYRRIWSIKSPNLLFVGL